MRLGLVAVAGDSPAMPSSDFASPQVLTRNILSHNGFHYLILDAAGRLPKCGLVSKLVHIALLVKIMDDQ